jgi:hypothetical protein
MRTHTPPVVTTREDGTNSTRHTVQRVCNGCHRGIGDVTEDEMNCITSGRPLPDVRHECPWCALFLAEERANGHA